VACGTLSPLSMRADAAIPVSRSVLEVVPRSRGVRRSVKAHSSTDNHAARPRRCGSCRSCGGYVAVYSNTDSVWHLCRCRLSYLRTHPSPEWASWWRTLVRRHAPIPLMGEPVRRSNGEADRHCVEHTLCPTCHLFRSHDTYRPASAARLSRWDHAARRCRLATTVAGDPRARSPYLCKLSTNKKRSQA
jgi:hypothetical protein